MRGKVERTFPKIRVIMSEQNPFIPNSFQTPNIYVDDFMAFVTEAEYKVLSYAARRVFGFGKSSDRISLSQFVTGIVTKNGKRLDYGTGLSKNTVRQCLIELIKFGLIMELHPGDPLTNQAAEYTLPTDITKVDFEGLKSRNQQSKKKRARTAPKPVSIGDTGTDGDMKPISNDDTGLYQTVIQPYITNCTRPVSNGDTTITSRKPVETKGKPVEAQSAPPPAPITKQPDLSDSTEATKAYAEVCHIRPDQTQRTAINRIVTNPDFFKEVCQGWRLAGYNVKNLQGILEWYQEGKTSNGTLIPTTSKVTSISRQGTARPGGTSTAGATAFIQRHLNKQQAG